jgi:hypothetical protein
MVGAYFTGDSEGDPMVRRIRARMSYANVMATLALFLALGGSSYAALQLPRNSVGSTQLKRNAVTSTKIKRSAVTTAKIKANAVTGAKINEATLAKVSQAAAADALSNLDYNAVSVANPPGQNTPGTVSCDPGQRVVGGGVKSDDILNQVLVDSYPRGTDGWSGTVFNGGGGTPNFTVFAICTSSTGTS